MKPIRKISWYLIIILVLTLLSGCVPRTTDSTEVGVITRKLSIFGKGGVDPEIVSPGITVFLVPFFTQFNTFDQTLQNIEMRKSVQSGDRAKEDDLLFKTIDGNDISLDVIIQYQIIPEKAPMILEYVASSNEELKDKIVRVISRGKARDLFGELETESFYVAEERNQKTAKVVKVLNEMLEPFGIVVKGIQLEDYRFNPEYQKAINEKKVADQDTEKYRSEIKAKIEEYKTKLREADAEVNKMVAIVDGEYEKAKIEADAYFEQQRLIAEAIIKEGEAEAEGLTKEIKALSGRGGETMVKLKIAENLAGKKILVLPTFKSGFDIKTTNINDLIKDALGKGGTASGVRQIKP